MCFDADEKLDIMESIFATEIDFDYYMQTKIILSHFPLHKRNTITHLEEEFGKLRSKLINGFLPFRNNKYIKYMEPLNIMKNYQGEKYTFEFTFLLHYQAWLYIPGLISLLLVGYQIQFFLYGQRTIKSTLDSEANLAFGFFVSIWATLFIESWKSVQ